MPSNFVFPWCSEFDKAVVYNEPYLCNLTGCMQGKASCSTEEKRAKEIPGKRESKGVPLCPRCVIQQQEV